MVQKSEIQVCMTHKFNYLKSRSKFKSGISIFFIIVFLLILSLIVVNIADLISSLISGNTSIFNGSKIRITSNTMYAVSLGQFSTKNDAETLANNVASQGAAGYIYQAGDYFVLTSMYDSIIDANSVIEKLKNDNLEAKIVNINIPTIILDYKGKFSNELIESIEFFKICYKKLYDLSINFDSGEITSGQTKQSILDLLSQAKQMQKTTQQMMQQEKLDFLINLDNKMLSLVTILDGLYVTDNQNLMFNSAIKNCYFKIIMLNVTFAKQV